MKISLTNWEQYLLCTCIVYAGDMGFLQTSSNADLNIKALQKIIDKMTIDTPIKTGGVNQFSSSLK